MKNEDGFNFIEYPCKSGKPDMLIVFFHGFSNHPEMFSELPKRFQKEWPNADVLLVPEPASLVLLALGGLLVVRRRVA